MGILKKKVKKQWVKALRSGKYTQGTGVLRRHLDYGSVRYCCLGVAAELFAKKAGCTVEQVWSARDTCFDQCDSYLPESLQRYMFKKSAVDQTNNLANPSVPYLGGRSGLAHLNDYQNLSFNQIADLIEEHL